VIARLERFRDRSPNQIQIHLGRIRQQRGFIGKPGGFVSILEKAAVFSSSRFARIGPTPLRAQHQPPSSDFLVIPSRYDIGA